MVKSKTVTECPGVGSSCAAISPAGPEPMMAILFPVSFEAGPRDKFPYRIKAACTALG